VREPPVAAPSRQFSGFGLDGVPGVG